MYITAIRIGTQRDSNGVRNNESFDNTYEDSRIRAPIEINDKCVIKDNTIIPEYDQYLNQISINHSYNYQNHQYLNSYHGSLHGNSHGNGRGQNKNKIEQPKHSSIGKAREKCQPDNTHLNHKHYKIYDYDHDGRNGGISGHGDQTSDRCKPRH